MKTGKRILSVILTVLLIFGTVSFVLPVNAEEGSPYQVGDIIEYGTYPQTLVTDETLIEQLNSFEKKGKSYEYYSGTGTWDDGKMVASDYMKFVDFFYNGSKYRAVTFSAYRPLMTGYQQTEDKTQQDDNGYFPNEVYYFLYEPLEWRVLDTETGYVVCNDVIDSQAFQDTVKTSNTPSNATNYNWPFANNYPLCSLRRWLNFDFFDTAFTENQNSNIRLSTWNNDAYSTSYSKYNAPESEDKIAVASYNDLKNASFGFSNNASRKAFCSDYAKCQGIYQENGFGWYWLRSPGKNSGFSCGVRSDGSIGVEGYVGSTRRGIRPVMFLNEIINDSSLSDVLFSETIGLSVWENDEPLILPRGTCEELNATVVPENEEIIWNSSDPTVATVDENGLVSSVREGISLITIKTKSKKFSDKCKVIVRGNGNNVYSLGEETYSFHNFGDDDSKGGHCFGMSVTSSMYYLGLLSKPKTGAEDRALYDYKYVDATDTLVIPQICYFQAIQGKYYKQSIVAGGYCDRIRLFHDLLVRVGLLSDWGEVVNYVKRHQYDDTGILGIRYVGEYEDDGEIKTDGHAVNFLRYAIVDGEERIYAYDNNSPNVETYFYKDKNNKIQQSPYQTFSVGINGISLFDISKLYFEAQKYKKSHAVYSNKDTIVVENAEVSYMACDMETEVRQVMHDVPDDLTQVRIAPLVDDAEFTYMDQTYHIHREDENTIGILTLAKAEEDTGTLTVINDPDHHVHIYTGELTAEPTCTADGKVTCSCTRCDNIKIETLPALGHYDNDDDNVCDECGEPMPQHEHDYTATVTTPATCTEPGVTTYTCVDGDDTYTEAIPALGHTDDNNDGHCDACGEQMQGGDHCKFCGKIHNGGFFDKLTGFFHKIFAIFKR